MDTNWIEKCLTSCKSIYKTKCVDTADGNKKHSCVEQEDEK